MIWFWSAAVVLAAAAIGWLLLPLARRGPREARIELPASNLAILRDQLAELDRDLAQGAISAEHHAQARSEIERRALEEGGAVTAAGDAPRARRGVRATLLALGAAIPVLAAVLYLALGNPQSILRATPGGDREEAGAERVGAMLAELAAGADRYPDEARGWAVLGRLYSVLGRHQESAAAYARLADLVKNDADVFADYAFALAQSQGRRADDKVRELVERALALDPGHLKALVMAGGAATQRGDHAAALRYWEAVQRQVAPDSQLGRAVASGIADARKAAAAGGTKQPAGAAASVSGTVRLIPALAARVAPEDTVFVSARAVKGPAMPLAVLRRRAADLPFAFTLDDAQAMMPEMKLSDYPEVTIAARVSKSGSATRQKGDLEGGGRNVRVGASGIELLIDRVVK